MATHLAAIAIMVHYVLAGTMHMKVPGHDPMSARPAASSSGIKMLGASPAAVKGRFCPFKGQAAPERSG